MSDVCLPRRTVETLLTQARVAPPRDQETVYALDDVEDELRRQAGDVPGQMRLNV